MGASALVLLVSMFAFDWYGLSGTLSTTASALGLPRSVNAWDGLTTLRWLLIVTIGCGFALVFLQAVRRAPAVPVSVNVILIVLSIITALALVYRVLINPPGSNSVIDQQAGAFVGLVSAIALMYGAYRSLRQEGVAPADAPAEIEIVPLSGGSGS